MRYHIVYFNILSITILYVIMMKISGQNSVAYVSDNEVRAENDHGVHSKERSSEEDEEEGKGDVVDPNDSNLREEMYITIHIYLQLLTDTVDRYSC